MFPDAVGSYHVSILLVLCLKAQHMCFEQEEGEVKSGNPKVPLSQSKEFGMMELKAAEDLMPRSQGCQCPQKLNATCKCGQQLAFLGRCLKIHSHFKGALGFQHIERQNPGIASL